jgi:AbrB family looped-hinge helix DNA binding protein
MPRVDSEGRVTIPASVRKALGIEPGDEIRFEPIDGGYALRKVGPRTVDGEDPFEKYRGSADSDETMSERMRRLRGRDSLSESDPD